LQYPKAARTPPVYAGPPVPAVAIPEGAWPGTIPEFASPGTILEGARVGRISEGVWPAYPVQERAPGVTLARVIVPGAGRAACPGGQHPGGQVQS